MVSKERTHNGAKEKAKGGSIIEGNMGNVGMERNEIWEYGNIRTGVGKRVCMGLYIILCRGYQSSFFSVRVAVGRQWGVVGIEVRQ